MKTIILFLFPLGLVSAAPNGTIRGLPRMDDCGKIRDKPYKWGRVTSGNRLSLAEFRDE
jgi:hypothetical protein